MATKKISVELLDLEDTRVEDSVVTVRLRCDSRTLSRLLEQSREDPGAESRPRRRLGKRSFRKYWKKLDPSRRLGLLAVAWYLDQAGLPLFRRADLDRLIEFLPEDQRPHLNQRTLIHLARKGWLERTRRGVYTLGEEGRSLMAELEDERREARRKTTRSRSRSARSEDRRDHPRIDGVSLFLREVPSATIWLKTLLCAYFLRRYCGIEEFDREMIEACFRRTRGHRVPSSLPTVLSQVLVRQQGSLESSDKRGFFRLTPDEYERLADQVYVKAAEKKLARSRKPVEGVDEDEPAESSAPRRASA